jgi:hypothetical protein
MPRARNSVFLEIQVPKEVQDNSQKTGVDQRNSLIAVAEQVFTTLSE